MARGVTSGEQRWQDRPVLAALVRGLAVVLPAAFAVAAGIATNALLADVATVGRITATFAIATVVLLVAERAARRLLPYAALLQLNLVFPDEMPSRYKVARNAWKVRDLEELVDRARRTGDVDEPARQAERVLELVTALRQHDRRTRGHSERVRLFVEMLADEVRITGEERDRLRWGALLHDIGKLTVDAAILNKDGRPTDEEWEQLKAHPAAGRRLAGGLGEWLGPWAGAIEDHHERWDGSGYPRGLAGEEISLGGRMVSLCDAFEVMTIARSYKRPMPMSAAREELARCAGTHFDPTLVRSFLNLGVGQLRWKAGAMAWVTLLPFVTSTPDEEEPVGPAAVAAPAEVADDTAHTGRSMPEEDVASESEPVAIDDTDPFSAAERALAAADRALARPPPPTGHDDLEPAGGELAPTSGGTGGEENDPFAVDLDEDDADDDYGADDHDDAFHHEP